MKFPKSLFKSPTVWHKYSTFVILTVVLLTFYVIQMVYLNSFISLKYGRKKDKEKSALSQNLTFEGERIVHFDFKGAPPKISFLRDFIPFIKKLGASGVLLEYDDMFPYYGQELKKISAANAYTSSDIAAIVQMAQENNLTLIPLIPTMGHFDFVLKLQEFAGFREVEDIPHALCPSQSKIYPLLHKMIDQILEAHPTANYLHIGGDDAYYIGMCSDCQFLMKKKKWRKEDIYFNHVKKLAKYIISTYPRVRPIIWGDRVLKKNERNIRAHGIPNLVDVMMWNFRPEENKFPRRDDMISFAKMFKNIWIAGAFKGATGSTQIVTDPDYHFRNVRAWMSFYDEWKNKVNFKGIVLAGWQRYDHFSVLCELLPVGIPSLALSLQYLQKDRVYDYDEVKHSLDCNDVVPLNLLDTQDEELMSRLYCSFPGYKIFKVIHSFYSAITELRKILKHLDYGDLSFYSVTHDTANPAYVRKVDLKKFQSLYNKIDQMEKEIRSALSEVYDHHTVDEWIFTYLLPQQFRLKSVINILIRMRTNIVWPRRPLPDIASQVRDFFNKTCDETEILGCTFFNIM